MSMSHAQGRCEHCYQCACKSASLSCACQAQGPTKASITERSAEDGDVAEVLARRRPAGARLAAAAAAASGEDAQQHQAHLQS
jgi:hypothetical protein